MGRSQPAANHTQGGGAARSGRSHHGTSLQVGVARVDYHDFANQIESVHGRNPVTDELGRKLQEASGLVQAPECLPTR